MVSRSMTQVGKWSRRIGGGVLVLALAGLLAPATTPGDARAEIIEVHSCAPGWTDIGGSCWPAPLTEPGGGSTDPGTNYYPSGGDSGGGGRVVPSGGGTTSGGGINKLALKRLIDQLRRECQSAGGTFWRYYLEGENMGHICQYRDLNATSYRDDYHNGEYSHTEVLRGDHWELVN